MTILQTAYDTTACSGYRYTKIKEDIRKASLMGGLLATPVKVDPHSPEYNLFLVQGGNASADSLAFFKHPVFIPSGTEQHTSDTEYYPVVDIRDFGKYNAPQAQFDVRNTIEFTWNIKRALLNKVWMDGRVEALRDISLLPAAVYAALVSESVARRFALDPAEQMTVQVIACYFYYSLFTDHDFEETIYHRTVSNVARITHVPAEQCYAILTNASLHNLADMCDLIRLRVKNVALDNLNVGTLFAVCCGTWFGTNAREVMAVGLEHPPTWIMIVSASLGSATYKRSTLAKLSQRFDKNGAAQNLNRSLETLIGDKNAVGVDGFGVF